MAFKNINEGSKFAKMTDLKVGDVVTGYVLAITESTKLPGALNLVMKVGDESISYSAAGTAKYALKDGKVTIGANTRITRIEDKVIKGKKTTNFLIEQDLEDVLAGVNTQPAAQAAPAAGIADKLKSLRGN